MTAADGNTGITAFWHKGDSIKFYLYEERKNNMKYVCDICGYIYDPEVGDPDNGIEAGTAFEALPEDWVCPLCGVGKEDFSPEA